MSKCGVYQILCKTTGHRYVGSAEDIDDRWVSHKANLRRGKHHNKALQYAWKLFGEESFEISLIEETYPGDLTLREAHHLLSIKPEFNVAPAGKRSEGRKKKITTTVRLPEELVHQMKEFSFLFKVSQTELMEKAIVEYIQKYGYRPHYVLKVTKDCYVLSRIEPNTSAVVDVQVRNGISPQQLQENYQGKYNCPVDLVIDLGPGEPK